MKSSSSEASRSDSTKLRPAPVEAVEKRTRRSFVEAASEIGRAIVGGTLGGGAPGKDGRVPAKSSAAASIHRLRDVLERDRAITAALDGDEQEPRSLVATARAKPATAHRHTSGPKVCEQCGAGEQTIAAARAAAAQPGAANQPGAAKRTASESRARPPERAPKKKSSAPPPLRVPPPPPRARASAAFVADERDDDEALSVHDEPTKVGPPPKHTEPLDERRAALAAAAASAFGSTPL